MDVGGRGDPNRYGGRRFERASELLRNVRADEAGGHRLLRLVSDPAGIYALAQLIVGLPRLPVALTDGEAGRTLRKHLGQRSFGVPINRIAQSVLELPPTEATYLSGRPRQALRTNLHRAQEQGITCMPLPEGAERELLNPRWLDTTFPNRDSPYTLHELMKPPHPGASRWIAVHGDSGPVAFGVISIDREWAMIHTHFSNAHLGGWALHTQLVRDAIERGARYVCVTEGNALLLSPGIQYFQRLLGYRVVNLTLG
jgi:hypothetical protein